MNTDIPFKEIVRNKLQSSYPNYATENFHLVSINKDNSIPIGTYSYAYTMYPSDYDVFENVTKGHNTDEVVNFFEKSLKHMVQKIMSRQYYWILEVKVGIDNRYNFKITDDDAMIRINCLKKNGLLLDEDIEIFQQNDQELSDELLRKYAVLRWTPQEILNGVKLLPGNKSISLNDAIRAKSQINIEIIALINNKFTDLSNFFVLSYTDKLGNPHAVNISEDSITDFTKFFKDNLKSNIKKLYYSKHNHDYYKIIKRYWSYGKFAKDKQLIHKLLPIVNSIIALAGQKRSELKTLINLVKHTNLQGVPMDVFHNQIQNLKASLSSLVDMGYDIIDAINYDLDIITNDNATPTEIINILDNVKETLNRYVSKNTLAYLKKVKLAPPPKKYIN
jgi:hypothetical protein